MKHMPEVFFVCASLLPDTTILIQEEDSESRVSKEGEQS